MDNETQSFDSTSSVIADTMSSTVSGEDFELNTGFTVPANESHVPNVTDEMIWVSNCGTFVADYGIVACVICAVAFIVGVVFCLFGEKLLIAQL